MILLYLIFVAIYFSLNNEFVYSISCKNEINQTVDFFVIKIYGSSGTFQKC